MKMLFFCTLFFGLTCFAAPSVTSVTASQRYPWYARAYIDVTFTAAQNEIDDLEISFSAAEGATRASLSVAHIIQNRADTGSDMTWTRHYVWDAAADVGEVLIEDVVLVVNAAGSSPVTRHFSLDCRAGAREVFAEAGPYTEIVNDVEWTFSIASGEVTIRRVPESAGETITIPSTLVGLPVTGIGEGAFSGYSGVKAVAIPGSVASIGRGAFSGCSGLRTLRVGYPDRDRILWLLEGSGFHVGVLDLHFFDGGSYTAVVDGIEWSFYCSDDKVVIGADDGAAAIPTSTAGAVVIPSELMGRPVTGIGPSAFRNCSSITSMTIPRGIESIVPGAFSGCGALAEIQVGYLEKDRILEGMSLSVIDTDAIEVRLLDGGTCQELVDGVEWSFSVSNGTATLESVPESLTGAVSIPRKLGGRLVTGVGEDAFHNCSGILSIEVPASVTSVGRGAFAGCTGLVMLVVDEDNPAYKVVDGQLVGKNGTTLIEAVVSSDDGALTIPAGVTHIDANAFHGCNGIRSIAIPDSVTSVGGGAFADCGALESIRVSYHERDRILGLVEGAGLDIGALTVLFFDGGPYAEVVDGIEWKFFIDNDRAVIASGTDEPAIPASTAGAFAIPTVLGTCPVKALGASAFMNCSSITSMRIPDEIEDIGNRAFHGCSALANIYVRTESAFRIQQLMEGSESPSFDASGIRFVSISYEGGPYIEGVGGIEWKYVVSSGEAVLGEGSIQGIAVPTSTAGEITIPSMLGGYKVTEINRYAFYGCDQITSVKIPEGVTTIGEHAFDRAGSLVSVTIPDSVTSIGSSAFIYDDNLASIAISTNVTSIGMSAFRGCNGLETIRVDFDDKDRIVGLLEASQFDTGGRTFRFFDGGPYTDWESSLRWTFFIRDDKAVICSGTENPAVPNSTISVNAIPDVLGTCPVVELGPNAFRGCAFLSSITIPAWIERIGDHAFDGCSMLRSITIPETVTDIGSSVFSGCAWLESVSIEAEVPVLGDEMFKDCASLVSVSMPGTVTKIGRMAFENCTSLAAVTLPGGITDIGESAFHGCIALGSLVIPDGVTTIGDGLLSGCDALTSVTIPDAVTDIGAMAFSGCVSLAAVSIPAGVTNIGEFAFSSCHSLTSVTIPDGMTTIGKYVFAWCFGLTSVTIPESVTTIDDDAFYNCEGFTSMTIPEGVASIGEYAFSRCSAISTVTISNNVTSICSNAFAGCSAFRSLRVSFPDRNRVVGLLADSGFDVDRLSYLYFDGGPYTAVADGIEWTFFCRNDRIVLGSDDGMAAIPASTTGAIRIPSELMGRPVKELGQSAFRGCGSVTSIEIPGGIDVIGAGAFAGCSGLDTLRVDSGHRTDILAKLEDSGFDLDGIAVVSICPRGSYQEEVDGVVWAFIIQDNQATVDYLSGSPVGAVTVPSELGGWPVTGISNFAFNSSRLRDITSVTIPNTVKYIGKDAFGFGGLRSATLSTGLLRIDTQAFRYSYGLHSINIPNSVQYIGDEAFYNCYAIQSAMIPDSVVSIGDRAFGKCTSLYSASIPYSVKDIGVSTFEGCEKLALLSIQNGVTNICRQAFSGCSALASVSIPASVEYIGNRAFYGCSGLASLAISDGVASIGDEAFSGCAIASLDIPGSVMDIGNSAFSACVNLASLKIRNGVANIGAGAFSGCSALASVSIPASVGRIGDGAFSGCTGLMSAAISDGVGGIGNEAFRGCGITSVDIPASVTSIGNSAFYGCADLASVTMHSGVTSIGDEAFSGCAITSLNIPGSVVRLGHRAFCGCAELASVSMHNGLLSIGNEAFSGCGIISVDIPLTVVSVGNDAFAGCDELETIRVAFQDKDRILPLLRASGLDVSGLSVRFFDGGPYTEVVDGIAWSFFIKDDKAVICSGTEAPAISASTAGAITIPSELGTVPVIGIGQNAFRGCGLITSVTIPDGIETIAERAFFGCVGIRAITVSAPASYRIIALLAGSDFDVDGIDVLVPDGGPYTEDVDGIEWKYFIVGGRAEIGTHDWETAVPESTVGAIEIPAVLGSCPVYMLNVGSFMNCGSITSIMIPDGIEYIGKQSFYGCSSLGEIRVSAGERDRLVELVRGSGNPALDMSGMTITVMLDDGGPYTEEIDGIEWTFSVAGGEARIDQVPASATGAVAVPSELGNRPVGAIGANAFSGCSGITTLSIPHGVTAIGVNAFSGCSGLETLIVGYPDRDRILVQMADSGFDVSVLAVETVNGGPYTEVVDGIAWKYFTKNGNVVISSGIGVAAIPTATTGAVVIPSVLGTCPVNELGQKVFKNCGSIVSITIPDSIEIIGYQSFYGCGALEEILISYSEKDRILGLMTDSTFDVRGLKVRSLDGGPYTDTVGGVEWTFSVADGKSTISGVPVSAAGAVAIPQELGGRPVTGIGENAFSGCIGITSISIPASVTNIGGGAFAGCSGLESFAVDPDNTEYESVDGLLLDRSGTALLECVMAGLDGSVTIPDGVTAIGANSFSGCSGIRSVSIPSDVASIGSGAFAGCDDLEMIRVAFPEKDRILALMAGSGVDVGSLDVRFFDGGPYSEVVDGIEWKFFTRNDKVVIGSGAGAAAIPTSTAGAITIPSVLGTRPVNELGQHAFMSCGLITSITFPEGIEHIGSASFYGCNNLTEIRVVGGDRDRIPAMMAGSSYDVRSLTVRLCDGGPYTEVVNGISWTFSIADGKATIGTGVQSSPAIPDSTAGAIAVPSVLGGYPVTAIGADAFFGCRITSVTIPACVANIDNNAFTYCPRLIAFAVDADNPGFKSENELLLSKDGKVLISGVGGDVVVPDCVTSIESGAFYNRQELRSVTMPDGLASIGDDAFALDNGLETLRVGLKARNRVVGLMFISGFDAFGLKIVVIYPDGGPYVEAVDGVEWTFFIEDGEAIVGGVPTATEGAITIPQELGERPVTSIGENAFAGCGGIASIEIPDAVTSIGSGAFAGCDALGVIRVAFPEKGRILALVAGSGRDVSGLEVWYVEGTVPIPEAWADNPGFAEKFGEDFEAALRKPTGKLDGAGNEMRVWHDYVAGTNPTDENDRFRATIRMVDGRPVVGWTPELPLEESARRVYGIFGKKLLTDAEWTDLSAASEEERAAYSFFRVTVDMR